MKSHIVLTEAPERALVCGSPERAAWIAETFLESPKSLHKNREYHSFKGTHQGKEILVLSHGIGSAGALICFREAFKAGVKSVIRVGTAGGLSADCQIGDVIVASGAVRKDGASRLMIPENFPAIADFGLTLNLENNLKKSGPVKSGIVLTSDLFYPGLIDDELKLYAKAGCVGVEMEISTLFVAASLDGVRAAACAVLDGNPLDWDKGSYDPDPERLKKSMARAVTASLETLAKI